MSPTERRGGSRVGFEGSGVGCVEEAKVGRGGSGVRCGEEETNDKMEYLDSPQN